MHTPILISATKLNRHSGELLRRVAIHGEHLLIERDGFPMAVIVPVGEYRKMRAAAGETLSESEGVGA